MSKLNSDKHIDIEFNLEEVDLTKSEAKATYREIKEYILEKYKVKVTNLYIAQIKRKYGLIERVNYNLSKKEAVKVPKCPPDKEEFITETLKHFKMI